MKCAEMPPNSGSDVFPNDLLKNGQNIGIPSEN